MAWIFGGAAETNKELTKPEIPPISSFVPSRDSKNYTFYTLDSKRRLSGNSSSFNITIPAEKLRTATRVAVIQISIPKSYYQVASNNNTFTLREGTDTATIDLDVGNYTLRGLKNKLQTLLNTNSPNNYVYTVSTTTEPDTGKLYFSVSGNSGVQPELIFTDELYEILGFEINSTNTFIADSLASTNIVNLNKETTLFLRSSICGNDGDNILAPIFGADTPYSSNIIWINPDIKTFSRTLVQGEQNVSFYLTNEEGKMMDLNGLNIVATLLFF